MAQRARRLGEVAQPALALGAHEQHVDVALDVRRETIPGGGVAELQMLGRDAVLAERAYAKAVNVEDATGPGREVRVPLEERRAGLLTADVHCASEDFVRRTDATVHQREVLVRRDDGVDQPGAGRRKIAPVQARPDAGRLDLVPEGVLYLD